MEVVSWNIALLLESFDQTLRMSFANSSLEKTENSGRY
jgi:hypothetical protein